MPGSKQGIGTALDAFVHDQIVKTDGNMRKLLKSRKMDFPDLYGCFQVLIGPDNKLLYDLILIKVGKAHHSREESNEKYTSVY